MFLLKKSSHWTSFALLAAAFFVSLSQVAFSSPVAEPQKGSQYYEMRIYKFKTPEQKAIVETYLRTAAIPALNRQGVATVGVFDEADQKDGLKLYVFIPYKSLDQFADISAKMAKELTSDAAYLQAASTYLAAPNAQPAFERIESILMQGFEEFPTLRVPKTMAPKAGRIYEFRIYESANEAKGLKKIEQFNKFEVKIFEKLGFNAAFYAQNLIGARLPSLSYMTTFDSKESREEHWKAFNADPEWTRVKALTEYAGVVSKQEIHFLNPTEYSQL